jgi:hypothetical protein
LRILFLLQGTSDVVSTELSATFFHSRVFCEVLQVNTLL